MKCQERVDPRAQRVGRSPTIANSEKALLREYRKYRNMGFSPKECEWKVYHHHTYKR